MFKEVEDLPTFNRGKYFPPESRNTAAQNWRDASVKALERRGLQDVPNAFTGRSVAVTRGIVGGDSVVSAYKKLTNILRTNGLYKTVRQQKRHEKKGVKRRRLASEGHRKKFAQIIRGKVALVQKSRARGS